LNLYTDRKVYHRLAAKLPTAEPTKSDWIRFSVEGDKPGVAAQRATHCSTYANDSAIATISQFPEAAWDPDQPQVGAKYGITWLTLADLHHNAVGDAPVAALVLVEDTIFFNITLSTTIKHITREDGEDENGVTRLMLGVLNHYPSLRASRFAEDVTRAGRDEVDWAAITGKHKTRAIDMYFGGQRFDPTQPGDWLALSALGMVGGNDDPMRRRKLTGKRLMKYRKGGAALAEDQMPHGWHHKKDHYGRALVEGERGLIPRADAGMIAVVQALYRAHAAGESYQALATRMIEFEADGLLRRRDHTDPGNTYAATADDVQARYDAAKSFFVRSSFRPQSIPTDDAIDDYLAGEDPAEVFDADTRLYLAKVELIRTGRYFRRLHNDIRGRNIVLDGIPATYRDDLDEYGWFDVLSAPWSWPVDDHGTEVPSFGLTDATCRQVAARLLRELRVPGEATGGRAHQRAERRALQRFENWHVSPGDLDARYDHEDTEWGVEARANVSGKANFILLHRPVSAGIGRRSNRGWSYVGPGEKKPDHIAATGSLSELTASVAVHLDRAVRDLLDTAEVATLRDVPSPDRTRDAAVGLRQKLDRKEVELAQAVKEAKGHRTLAAVAAADGEDDEAASYAAQGREASARAKVLQTDCNTLQAQLRDLQAGAQPRDDAADLSVAAFLVVGLEQAARNNGTGPARLGELCDTTFQSWRLGARGDDITWACEARLPLKSGGEVRLPLAGTISNVRTRTGKSLATTATAARYLFEEGRDLDTVAVLLQASRKTLLTKRVMPYLVEHGVRARGAKCALVDHPIADVRRHIHALISGTVTSCDLTHKAYRERLRRTYLDPELAWGDAAVPDDTTWIQAAVNLLTQDTASRKHGLPVLDVALAVGRPEADIRELVRPQKRSGGFTRPRYLVYADKAKARVKAIGCPHGRCKGRRFADHVALLPEVAASGYGVICRHCRRAPALHDEWPLTQFPPEYLQSWTCLGLGGSLRQESQTVLSKAAGPGSADNAMR
jgi:hypothetical protein